VPLTEFPKTIELKDGSRVCLRPLQSADEEALRAFFHRLSPEDRQFLKEDVLRPEIVHAWCHAPDFERVLPLLAEHEGRIVGDATLHRQPAGWKRHVGEIRVVTDPFFRRRGLASALARELFYIALQLGLDKMVAEVVADQVAAITVFEKLGFRREARLARQVVDLHGKRRDLILLTTDIPDLMRTMEEMILQAEGSRDG
jgi:RimJ/RimL family protein N-acetyltransferase